MKAEVPANLGKWVTDPHSGEKRFEVHPVTQEELDAAIEESRKIVKQLGLGISDQAMARARYAANVEPELWRRLGVATPEELPKALKDLANCLRDQGKLEEALVLLPDDPGLLSAKAAFDNPDDEFCDCNRPFQHKLVYYPEYGGSTNMWRCLACNRANVTHQVPPSEQWSHKARTKAWGDSPPSDAVLKNTGSKL